MASLDSSLLSLPAEIRLSIYRSALGQPLVKLSLPPFGALDLPEPPAKKPRPLKKRLALLFVNHQTYDECKDLIWNHATGRVQIYESLAILTQSAPIKSSLYAALEVLNICDHVNTGIRNKLQQIAIDYADIRWVTPSLKPLQDLTQGLPGVESLTIWCGEATWERGSATLLFLPTLKENGAEKMKVGDCIRDKTRAFGYLDSRLYGFDTKRIGGFLQETSRCHQCGKAGSVDRDEDQSEEGIEGKDRGRWKC